MNIAERKLLMAGLVSAFLVQTALVYTDDTAERLKPFHALALQGRAIWHANNCQVCHQLYGFGGFIGPDLTNVAARADRDRFDSILTNGSLQMPAFGFSSAEIDALVAFFETVDASGLGQAVQSPPPPATVLDKALVDAAQRAPMSEAAGRGYRLFKRQPCTGCHRILYSNCLGVATAPDLSLATRKLTDAEIDQVLREGRGMIMPRSGLDAAQRADLIAWMHWMTDHRSTIETCLELPAGHAALPWFEFAPPRARQDR
jgi:nitric oxide reductase subunit C